MVFGSGCPVVNGEYHFVGFTTENGYHSRLKNKENGMSYHYERIIPEDESEVDRKKITLFRCTMRSQQKWWFLSEADEEQPATDKDINYYQHKSMEDGEMGPPLSGWNTCCKPSGRGINPPPQLEKYGLMVPPGEEQNTLEHQLVDWAIKNEIIEMLVLGILSVHRKIISRSVPLINLTFMCDGNHRDETMTTLRLSPSMNIHDIDIVLKFLFRHGGNAKHSVIKENRFGHTLLSFFIGLEQGSQAKRLILNGGAQRLSERAAHEVRCRIYDHNKLAGQQILSWINKSMKFNATFLLFLCGTTINTATISAFTATSLSSSLSSPHGGYNLAEIIFQSQSNIRNELDCPICYDYAMNDTMRGEIYQCDSGYHLICGKCKANVHLCPSCRIPMGENRNRALEKVAALLIRPLQFLYGQTAVMELIGEYAGFVHGKELRMLKEFNDLIQIDTEMDEL